MKAKQQLASKERFVLVRRTRDRLVTCLKRRLKSYSRSDYLVALIIAAVPLLILGPLLFQRGYVIQYDMVFSPFVHLNLEAVRSGVGLYQGLPVTALFKLTSYVLPMDIVQKLLLYGIFFTGMLSMYRALPIRSVIARLIAGLMYVINPFTYDRLMAGHWRVLLAYSLTPLALRAFLNLYTSPSRRRLLIAGLLWTLLAVINAHHLLIIGVLFGCLGLFFVRTWRGVWYALGTILLVVLLNIWWLIPATNVPNHAYDFGLDHLYAFRTAVDRTHGIWFNMLSLQGFWFTEWRSIKDIAGIWPLLAIAWLVPVIVGLAGLSTYTRHHRRLIFGLLLASAAALVFAAGPHPSVWQLNTWVFENLPGFSGMREPHKFLALLALTYAVAAAFGIDMLVRRGANKAANTVAGLAVVATLLMGLPMLWGASGQIQTTHYPASWYQFRSILHADDDTTKAIVLPWELYTYDTFVNTLVANPARSFYGDRVIQSQRMNLAEVTDVESAAHVALSEAQAGEDVDALRSAMRSLGARYIIITSHSRAQEDYVWLLEHPATTTVIDDDQLLAITIDLAVDK
jgi:hypothetical protein